MSKKVVTIGEIMMRLSTPGYARFVQADSMDVVYAGSEANVAVSLSLFGMQAAHVTRFPEHDLGRAATQALERYGVDVRHIAYGPERIGVYFLENGAMQRPSRIIYDRFDSAFANIKLEHVDWDAILDGASWFHYTGITPAISQGAADVCLAGAKKARARGIKVSGDINYRRNLWQYGKTARDIMPALIEQTDVVVAGTTDFENCAGISGTDFTDTCRRAIEAFPNISKITSTHRESVSSSHNRMRAQLWDGRTLYTSREYDLTHIVDRVGTGDAYMAGLIYGWLNEKSDQQTLEFAIAACALKHSVPGDVNLVTVAEVEALQSGENVGKLLR
ncbi:sugar kinase [Chryseolinea sp. T2]|uniref:sugar kinase n=1 Tax=Chryseolinea sp. T2 TaxID=3129255 RepID=UPI0030781CEE